MVKKILTLSLLALFAVSAFAGERVLLRIGANGKQDAIPLKKGERAIDVIQKIENARTSASSSNSAGVIDTMYHYAGYAANGDNVFNTNFGWTHQDLAFQWYLPGAGGVAKELWWRNHGLVGAIGKGTIRAWLADPRLASLPANAVAGTGRMGYYDKTDDGDGLVTPFKSEATDPAWKPGNGSNAAIHYDPLGEESQWLPGGLQVTLEAATWQSLMLEDWGDDSMKFGLGQVFGFTLMNDSKVSDPDFDTRLEILSAPATAPHHSIKFYEIRTAPANTPGWQIREFEWGMYVVVEYTTDRPPVVALNVYSTTLETSPRPIVATITDDNPGGGPAGVASARLFTKKGALASYDSTTMNGTGSEYTANAPAAAPGDTVYWYIVATDVNGSRSAPLVRNYRVFQKSKANLLLYNNAAFSQGDARLIYVASQPNFDFWSAPGDGTGELGAALALYNHVVLGDGAFPSRNVYPAIEAWLKTGTSASKKNLFFSSQDYGCIADADCADVAFTTGQWEFDFLGVSAIGPQDLLGGTAVNVAKAFKLQPQSHPLTNYLAKYNTDSATTLYYWPASQLGISSYPDAMTAKAGATVLFTDAAGTQTLGVWNEGEGFTTAYFGFDASYALQFRSDTSVTPANDPKFRRVNSVQALALQFIALTTSVAPVSGVVPNEFSLGQNYPNPFNPTTSIEYTVPARSNVEISIFNILGQKVATVMNDVHEAGTHRATWNGKDQFGKSVASGIYFYQMRAGSFEQVKKMMLMK